MDWILSLWQCGNGVRSKKFSAFVDGGKRLKIKRGVMVKIIPIEKHLDNPYPTVLKSVITRFEVNIYFYW